VALHRFELHLSVLDRAAACQLSQILEAETFRSLLNIVPPKG
jgi:hypothetical protein